jgi:hypothetical protein
MWYDDVELILAQNSEQWRAVVNTLTNLRVSLKVGNFFISSVTICLLRILLHRAKMRGDAK